MATNGCIISEEMTLKHTCLMPKIPKINATVQLKQNAGSVKILTLNFRTITFHICHRGPIYMCLSVERHFPRNHRPPNGHNPIQDGCLATTFDESTYYYISDNVPEWQKTGDTGRSVWFGFRSKMVTGQSYFVSFMYARMECRWYFYSAFEDILKYLQISSNHLNYSTIQL